MQRAVMHRFHQQSVLQHKCDFFRERIVQAELLLVFHAQQLPFMSEVYVASIVFDLTCADIASSHQLNSVLGGR